MVAPALIFIGSILLPPCVSNVIVNCCPCLSASVPHATRAHDKTIAIVRMARTKRILFLLDFITNLAKIYCRASKKAKNITSFPR